jgi:hypothetical protein
LNLSWIFPESSLKLLWILSGAFMTLSWCRGSLWPARAQ